MCVIASLWSALDASGHGLGRSRMQALMHTCLARVPLGCAHIISRAGASSSSPMMSLLFFVLVLTRLPCSAECSTPQTIASATPVPRTWQTRS